MSNNYRERAMADFFSTLSEAVTSAGRCIGDGLNCKKLTSVTRAP
jgi:hypothetical protein